MSQMRIVASRLGELGIIIATVQAIRGRSWAPWAFAGITLGAVSVTADLLARQANGGVASQEEE